MSASFPIKLIVVVVCLAIALIVGATLGQCGGCSTPTIATLRGCGRTLLPKPKRITADDVVWRRRGSSGPWNHRTLARISCNVKQDNCAGFNVVETRQDGKRELRLVTRDRLQLRMVPRASESMPMTFDTQAGDEQEVKLSFDERGGVLWIRCRGPANECAVRLR